MEFYGKVTITVDRCIGVTCGRCGETTAYGHVVVIDREVDEKRYRITIKLCSGCMIETFRSVIDMLTKIDEGVRRLYGLKENEKEKEKDDSN